MSLGTINWLPDIRRWAQTIADFLTPGGYLYLLEGHLAALALDQSKEGRLIPTFPYFQGREPLVFDEEITYTGDSTKLENTRTYERIHPLSDIVNAVIGAGLSLDFLNEHARLPWKLFPCMVSDGNGIELLPTERPSLPLTFSLKATKL